MLFRSIGDQRFTKRIYRIVKKQHENRDLDSYEEIFKENKLKPQRGKHQVVNNIITGNWVATGTPKNHKKFVERMLKDNEIIEFDF